MGWKVEYREIFQISLEPYQMSSDSQFHYSTSDNGHRDIVFLRHIFEKVQS